MRCMKINKSKMYCAFYQSQTQITDDYGNKTGEYSLVYGDPIKFYAYVSPAKGEVNTKRFGENIPYDKVIVADNEAPLIDEFTHLWVDTMPQVDDQGKLALDSNGEVITPHDYIVKKIAKSLNSTVIAIRKVNVSE